ncbi:hypothetical protein L873DRAFT_139931 [Choiromyces venosus 120613-1]|uniref:Uncharacterized protein n=1 Tax=Choiromyces venosus 120613-1 TaxID=1336337 RepID=A0A3N4JG18_9PEZI|nr:hypothetical protein L873DRAFT_139931 [Choiromyces venosus 120613-1]
MVIAYFMNQFFFLSLRPPMVDKIGIPSGEQYLGVLFGVKCSCTSVSYHQFMIYPCTVNISNAVHFGQSQFTSNYMFLLITVLVSSRNASASRKFGEDSRKISAGGGILGKDA